MTWPSNSPVCLATEPLAELVWNNGPREGGSREPPEGNRQYLASRGAGAKLLK